MTENSQKEWWIEIEITPKNKNWGLNDNILLSLFNNFLEKKRENIKSWHFFREPTLRFRIELKDKETRDEIADKVKKFLDSNNLVEDYFFAKHGEKIDNLDEGYEGESKQYKRLWPYHKRIWECGAEMAVESIKEKEKTGGNKPTREYHLERAFHLLCNQMNPLSLNEVDLYNKCANDRLLVQAATRSQILDRKLLQSIIKESNKK